MSEEEKAETIEKAEKAEKPVKEKKSRKKPKATDRDAVSCALNACSSAPAEAPIPAKPGVRPEEWSASFPKPGFHQFAHVNGMAHGQYRLSGVCRFKATSDRPKDLPLPSYGTELAAGMDFISMEAGVIAPHKARAFRSGLLVEVAPGFEMQVRGRSGHALRSLISVTHGVGTIDADFRGEVLALLINHGDADFVVKPGDKIAQMVLAPIVQEANICLVDELSPTKRGDGGFGSTGR